MARVWFTSDLHFGHKNIGNFRKEIRDDLDNRRRISEDWCRDVSKRDTVWILGDIAFTDGGLKDVLALPGIKKVVLGNHDKYPIATYAKSFGKVVGLGRYKNAWLSHAPVHPDELRGKVNLHGHVHYQNIQEGSDPNRMRAPRDDARYFNCCVDNLWRKVGRSLISLEELRGLGVLK